MIYGIEAVLPVEVEYPSRCILMETELKEVECACSLFDQFNFIEEKRLTILRYGQEAHSWAYEEKVRPRIFEKVIDTKERIPMVNSSPTSKVHIL